MKLLFFAITMLCLTLVAAAGCGQKGPLFLPEDYGKSKSINEDNSGDIDPVTE